MDGPIKIYMGVPDRKYFIMPWSGTFPPKGQTVAFCDPRTKKGKAGTVVAYYTEPWVNLYDSFCLQHFNTDSARLKKHLEDNYPQYRNSEVIRFILFKET